jgi:hypothetical protein
VKFYELVRRDVRSVNDVIEEAPWRVVGVRDASHVRPAKGRK